MGPSLPWRHWVQLVERFLPWRHWVQFPPLCTCEVLKMHSVGVLVQYESHMHKHTHISQSQGPGDLPLLKDDKLSTAPMPLPMRLFEAGNCRLGEV